MRNVGSVSFHIQLRRCDMMSKPEVGKHVTFKFACFAHLFLVAEARQRQIAYRIINLHVCSFHLCYIDWISVTYSWHYYFLVLRRTFFRWAGELCGHYAIWSGIKRQLILQWKNTFHGILHWCLYEEICVILWCFLSLSATVLTGTCRSTSYKWRSH